MLLFVVCLTVCIYDARMCEVAVGIVDYGHSHRFLVQLHMQRKTTNTNLLKYDLAVNYFIMLI